MTNFAFQCGGCDPPRILYHSLLDRIRRTCHVCHSPYCVDISTLQGSFEDITFTPALAKVYLEDCYPLARSEVDPATVAKYASLLQRNQWQHLDLSAGGAHCPITVKDGRVLLGVTRLMAVVEAGVPMRAVLCTIGGNDG